MKIMITGAKGFIGKNLCAFLKNEGFNDLLLFDTDNSERELEEYTKQCSFVFHFAGINRPVNNDEFYLGNSDFTKKLCFYLKQAHNACPLLMSSSIQAEKDNDYGKSKLLAEQTVQNLSVENGNPVYIYRLPNVFGKWCRPNYNSVVATFCYNAANGLPLKVNDASAKITLAYIDDLAEEFIGVLKNRNSNFSGYLSPKITHCTTVTKLAKTIQSFAKERKDFFLPQLKKGSLEKKLYSTYLSYLPENQFSYNLLQHCDERGSFTEILKTECYGQVSVNVAKPGIVKGNHWHNTKVEKFLVVSGQAVIRFRKIGEQKIIDYYVSGEKPEVVDIPCGYTHSIENIGQSDLITIMWANETFDKNKPDTFFEEV